MTESNLAFMIFGTIAIIVSWVIALFILMVIKNKKNVKMKFKIIKEVNQFETLYWTEPIGILNRLVHMYNPFLFKLDAKEAWACFDTIEEAKDHIKKWNSGYYKKKYYKKRVA